MKINNISFTDFKNLQGSYDLSSDINIVIGQNGVGKTNLLEAINILTTGNSIRHRDERNLINFESIYKFAQINAQISIEENNQELEFKYIVADDIGILKKGYFINQKKVSKIKFVFQFASIFFLPQDIDFIDGSSNLRRDEIDGFLCIFDPEYYQVTRRYMQILKNRNQLLKTNRVKKIDMQELVFWDEALVEVGSFIIYKRIEKLKGILPDILDISESIFAHKFHNLELRYLTKIIEEEILDEDSIQKKFRSKVKYNKNKEISAGLTLYGPQRDDWKFFSDRRDLHEFASRGQQRLLSLVFKLALLRDYERKKNKKPVLILDDVMSELDVDNRKNLEEFFRNSGNQIIATSASQDDFSKDFLSKTNLICL